MNGGAQQARAFLARHGMDSTAFPLTQLRALCLADMERGLAGQKATMHMLPAYVRDGAPEGGGTALVMDAGGTNLRAALVRLGPDGPQTGYFVKSPMPGTHEACTAPEFFDGLAAQLLPVAGASDRACLCFSYPCRIQPDGDGVLLGLCKELRVSGAQGLHVCRELEAALRRQGAPGTRRWRLINDTVAAYLGATAGTDGAVRCIGFVLGTGVNVCYAEPAGQIRSDPAAAAWDGRMAVNTEAGCFGLFPQGDIDLLLDADSALPGDHLAEKMISGGYLPELARRTLLCAAQEGLLPQAAELALLRTTLTMQDVGQLITGTLPEALSPLADAAFCQGVADGLLERAARFSTAMLSAAAVRSGAGPGGTVRICTEGSTVNCTPTLRARIGAHLSALADAGEGPACTLVTIPDVTLLGSALAALQ